MREPSLLQSRAGRSVFLVLTALVMAACGQPDGQTDPSMTAPPTVDQTSTPTERTPDPTSPDGESTEAVAAMTFTDCETDRYTVGYPTEWETNPDDGLLQACEIFHPGDIEVPERPRDRDLHYAVSMYVDDVDFEDRAAGDNPNEVIEEREATVEGRQALVLEYRSTGDALVPEDEYSYTWSIDLDGQILVANTSSVGDTDYERDKRVLDRMITEELTIHDEPAAVEGPATTERSTEEPEGWPLVVTDVEVGSHDSFDRIVFHIGGDGEAGWLIEYEADPRSQGSGGARRRRRRHGPARDPARHGLSRRRSRGTVRRSGTHPP